MAPNTMQETQKQNDQKSNNQKSPSGSAEKSISELKDVYDAAFQGFCEYAKSKPETVALWCLGIGFVLGWKLRP